MGARLFRLPGWGRIASNIKLFIRRCVVESARIPPLDAFYKAIYRVHVSYALRCLKTLPHTRSIYVARGVATGKSSRASAMSISWFWASGPTLNKPTSWQVCGGSAHFRPYTMPPFGSTHTHCRAAFVVCDRSLLPMPFRPRPHAMETAVRRGCDRPFGSSADRTSGGRLLHGHPQLVGYIQAQRFRDRSHGTRFHLPEQRGLQDGRRDRQQIGWPARKSVAGFQEKGYCRCQSSIDGLGTARISNDWNVARKLAIGASKATFAKRLSSSCCGTWMRCMPVSVTLPRFRTPAARLCLWTRRARKFC